MRADIRQRLEQVPALKGHIQGAAKLANLTESGAAFQGDLAAFVLPLGLRGGAVADATGMFIQGIDRLVGVVLMIRNLSDATGDKGAADLEVLIEDVILAIVGEGPDNAIGVWVLASGELVSIAKGVITYQLNFGLADQLRVQR